jgi:hypothetical protein
MECYGSGTDLTYGDDAGDWSVSVELPDAGGAGTMPSGMGAQVFVMAHMNGSNPQMLPGDNCQATIKSDTADRVEGTITCKGQQWLSPTSGTAPAPSGTPVDVKITFTATP